mgnify:CR=1 FL=1|jgi:hypothetical protein
MTPKITQFTCTSAAPYDRHHYKVHSENNKSKYFESWEQLQLYWFNNCRLKNLKCISVEDIKSSRGFK